MKLAQSDATPRVARLTAPSTEIARYLLMESRFSNALERLSRRITIELRQRLRQYQQQGQKHER